MRRPVLPRLAHGTIVRRTGPRGQRFTRGAAVHQTASSRVVASSRRTNSRWIPTTGIGEVSGCRVGDINTVDWTWRIRRQTTTSPGGLVDKGTKGKRARTVPLIEEIRPLVQAGIERVNRKPDARLFTGPRGGRISTAVLRDATHWDEVVNALGYEHLRRHSLRHTGLTRMADAGVPVHHL
ncbi:tyrosine-type recombinase/integrase [Actinosynnema sp. CS-041913]|uniref:tyrosine-type recombinase/integrase n=1 Tax=Actinosynnema sp. CS-041913 TaxID=3239917 RepID=UPI003D8DC21C